MAAPLVPDDDLYARLEVAVDASPEAIELAWRALLKRHHPDVAGDDARALDRAKRINVAHDWLADPALRSRYDRERHTGRSPGASDRERTGVRYGRSPRAWPQQHAAPRRAPQRRRSTRTDLARGEPAERLARFLARVSRLTPDELDRLAAAEPPPIAFLATIRRFLTPDAAASFGAAEIAITARVPRERWAQVGLREGLLGVAAELVLSGFLDETLAEPFRGRARDRLLRAWEVSVDQPRYGPNGDDVVRVRDRAAGMTRAEVVALIHASTGVAGDDRPWPPALDPDEDEALRISAVLAARDVAGALPVDDLAPATASRARRLLARRGHVAALRHAFPAPVYAALAAPFDEATGGGGAPAAHDGRQAAPGVRRSR